MNYFHCDCITGAQDHIDDESIDLLACDPPFGINESSFQKHYKRENEYVISGYQEAPDDYYLFTLNWMTEGKRVLKKNGSFYIISGHTNLPIILNVAESLDLTLVNHIIWKYNFGVYTRKKYVTSHYHILYFTKQKAKPTFNTHCRFGPSEKDSDGRSLLYQDLEDVWFIKKEYQHKTKKNSNKLPNTLLEKIILYSSNENDMVCDFFLGNFTTSIVAKQLGRKSCGFELNEIAFNQGIKNMDAISYGEQLKTLKKVKVIKPRNQGKPLSEETKKEIVFDFNALVSQGVTKKSATKIIGEKYGRGKFSIQRIIE